MRISVSYFVTTAVVARARLHEASARTLDAVLDVDGMGEYITLM